MIPIPFPRVGGNNYIPLYIKYYKQIPLLENVRKRVSRGNFNEEIYSINNFPALKPGELNRADYERPVVLTPYFKSHPAYFSDFMAFQHLELWLQGLSLKNDKFVPDDSKIPLVFSCRIAGNYQKLIGPIHFYLGNITYHISDFKTGEEVSSNETLINYKKGGSLLPSIFEPKEGKNWGSKKNFCLSMEDYSQSENFFEVRILDAEKDLEGRLFFQTKKTNFEGGYAEILNSGDNKFPIREIMTKRWVEFEKDKSFLLYKGQSINFSKLKTTCFIDESSGFPYSKKSWDWMIFKSDSSSKEDIRLIMGKRCKRAGHPILERNIATLFVNGEIYRLRGGVLFFYDINNLENPWRVTFSDEKNSIKVTTKQIAPLVEKSFIHEKMGPINVGLDLQRIIADTEVNIDLKGRKINVNGIGSFESNKGIERGTRYFKD